MSLWLLLKTQVVKIIFQLNKVPNYDQENNAPHSPDNKSVKSRSSISKKNIILKRISNVKTISDYSDTASPKKYKRNETDKELENLMIRLPTMDPEDKGPKINYTDGITKDHIEKLRKESVNRILAK